MVRDGALARRVRRVVQNARPLEPHRRRPAAVRRMSSRHAPAGRPSTATTMSVRRSPNGASRGGRIHFAIFRPTTCQLLLDWERIDNGLKSRERVVKLLMPSEVGGTASATRRLSRCGASDGQGPTRSIPSFGMAGAHLLSSAQTERGDRASSTASLPSVPNTS